jgi:lipoprotein NlpI
MSRLVISMSGLLFGLLLWPALAHAESADELLSRARAAWKNGKEREAVVLAGKAIDLEPKNSRLWFFRGTLHEAQNQHREAVADFTRAITLDPKEAEAYHHRGCEQFKLGQVAESVRDFDAYIERKPERKASHWQRGISYYYVGRYKDGQDQFEGYQTFDSNDVENAVWRYLCMAKVVGRDKARAALLKIGEDKRVPMKEVYELFRGKLKPADVLAAAEAGKASSEQRNAQRFYAHLYLGLWYDSENDQARALEHLGKAADEHRIGHYMWDVARVHRDLLRKTGQTK